MTVVRYTLLRLMLLFACLIVVWLVFQAFGWHDPLLLLLVTAVLSVLLSYVVLRGPRLALTQQIADRAAAQAGGLPDRDAEAEDAEADATAGSAEGEAEPEQQAEGQLGSPGVAQSGDEGPSGAPGADGADGRPEQRR